MSNYRNTFFDQAERLRQKMSLTGGEKGKDDDASSLPPRSDVHKDKKKKTKLKIKYPIIRLLVLFFILLPISILSLKYYADQNQAVNNEVTSIDRSGYEEVKIEPKVNDNSVEGSFEEPENDDKPIQNDNLETDETLEVQPSKQEEGNDNFARNEESDSTKSDHNSSEQEQQYEIIYHKVTADDTLYRISINYYGSRSGEELIKKWNNLNDTKIFAGQVLKIPIEAH